MIRVRSNLGHHDGVRVPRSKGIQSRDVLQRVPNQGPGMTCGGTALSNLAMGGVGRGYWLRGKVVSRG
ncbi:MAG TPA: hypothetical protein VMV61_08305 [Patescibacteria group bacterium]|nr:hypothetical protein [Patescibacteria group bacterium]